jgi:hypothetical protein
VVLAAGLVVGPVLVVGPMFVAAPAERSAPPGIPLLAYYYAWFDAGSWDRAKRDYPLLGRYSSDDPRVMRQQIQWAKSAGIDGFVVSWKDTPTNDRRLRTLMKVATQEDFKLAMIYQGLDFDRHRLPIARIAADFTMFRDRFAGDPVFYRLGGKPLTIWSGTWEFSPAEVARVTGTVQGSLLVLSTEKNVNGYRRLAQVTDGDAYYWSSVDPDTNANYGAKLSEMSRAIHADGKYWVAPFAPGFDAGLVGGTKSVDRRNGQTLRTEYAMAVRSSPDVLGLISWNEFSENSYVEPSQKYGTRYLDVLRELRRTASPNPPLATDSSDSAIGHRKAVPAPWSNLLLLIGFPVVLGAGVAVVAVLRRRRPRPGP